MRLAPDIDTAFLYLGQEAAEHLKQHREEGLPDYGPINKKAPLTICNEAADDVLKVYRIDKEASLPIREIGSDGYGLRSAVNVTADGGKFLWINTGLLMELKYGKVGNIKERSSLAAAGITNPDGVVDSRYHGEVVVPFKNDTGKDYSINISDRIVQMVFHLPVSSSRSGRGSD